MTEDQKLSDERCTCSCHRCCVPPDACCEDCEEEHAEEGDDIRWRKDTPMTDPHTDALARADRALREALAAVESALASRPTVRVVHTGGGCQPPPVHTCTDQCTTTTADMAGVCWLSAGEVERAHRVAQDRLDWLRRWFPLSEETDR